MLGVATRHESFACKVASGSSAGSATLVSISSSSSSSTRRRRANGGEPERTGLLGPPSFELLPRSTMICRPAVAMPDLVALHDIRIMARRADQIIIEKNNQTKDEVLPKSAAT